MFVNGQGSSGGYQIPNSLRFRASGSAYLNRTPAGAGNRQKWTFSGWVKRGALGTVSTIMQAGTGGSNYTDALYFDASDRIACDGVDTGAAAFTFVSLAKYRDPTAHMHVVVAFDTTNATAADRVKVWVNGSAVAPDGSSSNPTLNGNYTINSTNEHRIGRSWGVNTYYHDGLLSEINFIDGQALTPSSFGQTNADGVWVPKKYTGSYTGNSFYLPFSEGTSATTLAYDKSGLGNNWTATNISTTAGEDYDWMVDTPTNNYAVFDSLTRTVGTYAKANLAFTASNTTPRAGASSFATITTPIYFEWRVASTSAGQTYAGIITLPNDESASGQRYYLPGGSGTAGAAAGWGCQSATQAPFFIGGNLTPAFTKSGLTLTSSSVFQIAFDPVSRKIWCGIDNTWYDSAGNATGNPSGGTNQTGTLTSGDTYYVSIGGSTPQTCYINFGQAPLTASATYDSASGGYFRYAAPTGFKSLCTANLPAVAITNPRKHFDVVTRTGTAGTYSVTGRQFSPDFVWVKSRGRAVDHALYDVVRGVEKRLETNNTDAEVTGDTTGLTAFNSDGYTGGALDQINGTTATNSFVDWLWKANGAGVTNTDGTITSTVSANQTAGFSIVTYTGTGASNATVGHGLGKTPAMILLKDRDANGSNNSWWAWHKYFTTAGYIILNSTGAWVAGYPGGGAIGVTPNSTTFTLANGATNNQNSNENTDKFVAYCFAEIVGFSKFGSYLSNNSNNGPFIYCGFRPAFILLKNADQSSNWVIYDGFRNTYNVSETVLRANTAESESTIGVTFDIDILSNGFKCRSITTDTNSATTTSAVIYAAFAEYPFGGHNVAPSPAR